MSDYPLPLPNELIEEARRLAAESRVSLNQWFLGAIADKIEAERMMRSLRQYAEKVDEARLDEILARVPDVDPIPGDEL